MAGAFLVCCSVVAVADDWPQWRGPNRNGVSEEKGLLKEWPAGGPKLAWSRTDLGTGYSTPSVVGDRLYVLGSAGIESEFVEARSTRDGAKVWSARLGKVGNPEQKPSFPAARSTPTVAGDDLFALGSDGDLACLETGTGKVRWTKSLRSDLGGKPGIWAYSESPLVDGDRVICMPGGAEATLVALDRKTGAVVWKCAIPEADAASYASVQVAKIAGVKQYVQLASKGLVGVDAATGKVLWRQEKWTSRYGANIPTPVIAGDQIYAGAAGTGGGLLKVSAKGGGVEAEPVYFDSKLPTAIGSAVKVGEFLYGTTGSALLCVEWATGQVKWEDRSIGTASICVADGRLYLHGENGQVALVDPSPEGYREKGRFTPPEPPKHENMEKAWAYPVVAGGRLYLRDHASLWCYEVK